MPGPGCRGPLADLTRRASPGGQRKRVESVGIGTQVGRLGSFVKSRAGGQAEMEVAEKDVVR